MKLLFLFADENHCDYAFDGLYIGAVNSGHTVDALPLPLGLCNANEKHFYTRVNGFFKDYLKGKIAPIKQLRDDYDAIIFESAGIPYKLFPFYKQYGFTQLWNSSIPKCCVLGNDPFTSQPLPNLRYDYKCKMAIREKALQTPIVNLPYSADFPLHFTIPQAWLGGNDQREKDYFFSMSPSNPVRKEFSQKFLNQHYTNIGEYLNAIRRHKFGLSIFGDGIECQRDVELGGNTLLAIYKHARSVYDGSYFTTDNAIYYSSYESLIEQTKALEKSGEYENMRKKCFEFTKQNLTCESQLYKLLDWLVK